MSKLKVARFPRLAPEGFIAIRELASIRYRPSPRILVRPLTRPEGSEPKDDDSEYWKREHFDWEILYGESRWLHMRNSISLYAEWREQTRNLQLIQVDASSRQAWALQKAVRCYERQREKEKSKPTRAQAGGASTQSPTRTLNASAETRALDGGTQVNAEIEAKPTVKRTKWGVKIPSNDGQHFFGIGVWKSTKYAGCTTIALFVAGRRCLYTVDKSHMAALRCEISRGEPT